MTEDPNEAFLGFIIFLKGKRDDQFEEVDSAYLSDELFRDCECQGKVLQLYFFSHEEPVELHVYCPNEETNQVRGRHDQEGQRSDSREEADSSCQEKKGQKVRDNTTLKKLVDTMSLQNGGVLCSDLASLFGVS